MKLLLDTHALIWWLLGDKSLSNSASAAIGDDANTISVSAVSAMEVTSKYRAGKLPQAEVFARDFEVMVEAQGFARLSITVTHARVAGLMKFITKTLLTACSLRRRRSRNWCWSRTRSCST